MRAGIETASPAPLIDVDRNAADPYRAYLHVAIENLPAYRWVHPDEER
jgi:hypothetical protein